MQSKVTDIDAYLDEAPAERRTALERLRTLCLQVHPDAQEGIDYGMPVFKRDGVMLLAFASQERYIALYGLGAETLERHRDKLAAADLGKGCIRYRKADRIDFALVEAMMIEARDAGRAGC